MDDRVHQMIRRADAVMRPSRRRRRCVTRTRTYVAECYTDRSDSDNDIKHLNAFAWNKKICMHFFWLRCTCLRAPMRHRWSNAHARSWTQTLRLWRLSLGEMCVCALGNSLTVEGASRVKLQLDVSAALTSLTQNTARNISAISVFEVGLRLHRKTIGAKMYERRTKKWPKKSTISRTRKGTKNEKKVVK